MAAPAVVRYCTLILYTLQLYERLYPLRLGVGRVHGSVSLKLKWILFILKTSSVLVSALTTPLRSAVQSARLV